MEKNKTGKNTHCPYRKHCTDVCYGEYPCDHAQKYDLLYHRIKNLKKSVSSLSAANCILQEKLIAAPLHEMATLKQRDKLLEEKWLELEDVPVNPETEKLEAPFMHFPIGTDKEDIWHWFDERHSKGIVHLLYHEGIEHYPELQKLFHRRACCFECDSETCALNPEGICLYPLLYGSVPEYVDDVGCKGFLYKEG